MKEKRFQLLILSPLKRTWGIKMKQWTAFIKKEYLEQLRTGKLLVLLILFCLFGIMNPAIAKLTPWMMEILSSQMEESGMIVTGVKVDAMTSWVQFFKNMPMALIVFMIMFSGSFTTEYQKGTLVNVVTKGMKRYKILAAKMGIMMMIWTLGCLVSFGITFGYNAFFWDNSVVHHIGFSVFCFYLLGLWLTADLILASVLCQSASAVTIVTGVMFLVSYLIGMIPVVSEYLPTYLLRSGELLTGAKSAGGYCISVAVTILFIVLEAVLSTVIFNKRNL